MDTIWFLLYNTCAASKRLSGSCLYFCSVHHEKQESQECSKRDQKTPFPHSLARPTEGTDDEGGHRVLLIAVSTTNLTTLQSTIGTLWNTNDRSS